MLSLVVAADENNVIGNAGGMPWHLPADLAHFKRITMGKPIVMGRRTFEAIGRALPGRRNIVLSRNREFSAAGAECVTNLDEALRLAGDAQEIMVIGGGQLFRSALPLAGRIYFTRIHAQFTGDVFFPTLPPGEWREISRENRDADTSNPQPLSFLVLERKP